MHTRRVGFKQCTRRSSSKSKGGRGGPCCYQVEIYHFAFQVSGTILIFREMLRANPDQMAMLKQNNPKLSEALESGDLEAFAKVSIQIT